MQAGGGCNKAMSKIAKVNRLSRTKTKKKRRMIRTFESGLEKIFLYKFPLEALVLQKEK